MERGPEHARPGNLPNPGAGTVQIPCLARPDISYGTQGKASTTLCAAMPTNARNDRRLITYDGRRHDREPDVRGHVLSRTDYWSLATQTAPAVAQDQRVDSRPAADHGPGLLAICTHSHIS
jgi:hypothetical protein